MCEQALLPTPRLTPLITPLVGAVKDTGQRVNDVVATYRIGDVAIVADDAEEMGRSFLLRWGFKNTESWTVVGSFDANAPAGVVAKHRSRAMRLEHAAW